MSASLIAPASAPRRAGDLERWSTTLALALAVAAAVLGAIVIARADGGMDALRAVLVLWGAAPALVAWVVSHTSRRVAVRVPALWFATVPAAFAAIVSYLVLAPTFVLLLTAAIAATRSTGLPGEAGRAARASAGALIFVAGWGAGFLALFVSSDERCVSTATSVSCSSDVVTMPEAAIAVALLAAGVGAVLVLTRQR